jgi:hypothetical protein
MCWVHVSRENISVPADGNPVTGEGYTAANDDKESPSTAAVTTTNGKGSAEVRRNRVPPGGYSSGLWWTVHLPLLLSLPDHL